MLNLIFALAHIGMLDLKKHIRLLIQTLLQSELCKSVEPVVLKIPSILMEKE